MELETYVLTCGTLVAPPKLFCKSGLSPPIITALGPRLTNSKSQKDFEILALNKSSIIKGGTDVSYIGSLGWGRAVRVLSEPKTLDEDRMVCPKHLQALCDIPKAQTEAQ